MLKRNGEIPWIPSLTQALSKLAISVSGLLVALILAEVTLRVVGISYPSFWALDAERGWAARPGTEGRYVKEGETYVRINREGFRDEDHEENRPPGTFRIAILGDSFVEALQVDLESTFWKVLERELATCRAFLGYDVEVLGFGGSGYGTAQERIVFRTFVEKFEPDVVILAFFLGNDIPDNYHALDNMDFRPYYVFERDGLILDRSFQEGVDSRLSNVWRAHLVSLVDRIRILQLLKEADHARRRYVHRRHGGSITVDQGTARGVFLAPQDSDWAEAWRVTEAILTSLHDDVENEDANLWLVTIPAPVQAHPDPAVRESFAEQLGVETLSYPESRLKAWADGNAVPFIGLSETFREHAERERVYLYGFENHVGYGHWNESGHQLAGRTITQTLCEAYSKRNHW